MTVNDPNVTPKMDGDEPVKAPIGLIILVVALGIAIIAMLGLMVYKLMNGDASKSKDTQEVGIVAESPLTPSVNFEEITLKKPAGGRLADVKLHSATILLHYKTEKGETLILVDKHTGKESRIIIPE